MIKLILCVTAALKLASAQYNGIIWDAEPQYQPQYQPQYSQPQVHSDKNREAAEEPIVGSPLLPLLPHRLNPLGLGGLGGIPGLRFGSINAGHLGGLMYGNSLLGAPNPMADDQAEAQYQANVDPQIASQYQPEYQADPQVAAQPDASSYGHGKHWWWKKWANDDQSGSVVGASPCSCAQQSHSYSGYVAQPQSYEVAQPQSYEVAQPQSYEVASPQNYQAYPQYTSYQSQLPQIISEYPSPAYRAQIDYQQIQPQQIQSQPIVQPAGTYESSEKSAASDSNADERSWDWSWKNDKKAAIKDKFYSKKDKFNKDDKFSKGGHHHVHVHPEPHVHVHPPAPQYYPQQHTYYQQQPTYYSKPAYTKPVYTKPAPAQAQPVQYNNYYNAYRSSNLEAEQPLDTEVKTEVGQSQDLKITTTEASSNKTTTTASCYSPNELTTKSQSTTSTDERNAIAVSTTTEKSKKKKNNDDKSKKSSRRRRDVPSPSTNIKRCITFTDPIFLGVPLPGLNLLGAPNPNAAAEDDSTQDLVSNPSENCESGDCSNPTDPPQPTTTQPPPSRFFGALGPDRTQQLFRVLGTEPYLGAVLEDNNKLWNNDALMGRIMGQVEDTYLDFVKHNENLPRIQDVRIIT